MLVKSEFLFEDEMGVVVNWSVQSGDDEVEDEEEDDGVCDLIWIPISIR